MPEREGPGCRCGHGKLEADDARGVVEEGLAREQRLLALGEGDVCSQGGDGRGVGGAKGSAQGKGRGEGNRGVGEVEGGAHDEGGPDHKANREGGNGRPSA